MVMLGKTTEQKPGSSHPVLPGGSYLCPQSQSFSSLEPSLGTRPRLLPLVPPGLGDVGTAQQMVLFSLMAFQCVESPEVEGQASDMVLPLTCCGSRPLHLLPCPVHHHGTSRFSPQVCGCHLSLWTHKCFTH
jgi:hypothetical protein